MKQFVVTPAAGKRLIAQALAAHPLVRDALESHTVVIVAGTTNGYVADEVLRSLGVVAGVERRRFFRGITLPPGRATTTAGRLPDESAFPGDVVLRHGVWATGETVFDAIDDLAEGDLVLKGANALDLATKRAAVLIGDPRAGTAGAIVPAVVGRRVRLIVPVGLEKRIAGDLDELAARLNAPGARGPRLFPLPGTVFTELDAVASLTGATASLVAGGGVCGAEGGVWLAVDGDDEAIEKAERVIHSVEGEPAFEL